MADTRYLIQRRQSWFFRRRVPTDLIEKYGSAHIVVPLGTRDLSVAQKARWEKAKFYDDLFDRMREGKTLTPDEQDKIATAAYHDKLKELDEASRLNGAGDAVDYGDDPTGRPVEITQEELSIEIEFDRLTEILEYLDRGERLTTSQEAVISEVVQDALKDTGAVLDPASERAVGEKLIWAKVEGLNARKAVLSGKAYNPREDNFLSPPEIDPLTAQPTLKARRKRGRKTTSRSGVMTFSKAAESYVEEQQRDEGSSWTKKTQAQYEATFRLFEQYTSDPSLDTVTTADASGFLNTVADLQPHWGRSPATKNLDVWEILKKHTSKTGKGLTNKTLNRYSTSLAGVWTWAKKRGHLDADAINPFAGQHRKVSKSRDVGWLPYTVDELNLLFSSVFFKKTPRDARVSPNKHTLDTAKLWVPLIGLFSGMRLEEICGLNREDIMEEKGALYFDVKDAKTPAGDRKVPVHEMLIKVGFKEYLKGIDGSLFPGLKSGGGDNKKSQYFTKRFTEFRRGVGITRDRVVFHSFRKNFVTALEQASVPYNQLAQIIGHEKGFTYDVYSAGLTVPQLKPVVDQVGYDGLDLRHLYVD